MKDNSNNSFGRSALVVLLPFIFLVILLSSTVSAVPPITTIDNPEAFFVQPIDIEVIKADSPFVFHVHAFNQSGFPLRNATASCYLHVYNSTSDYEHIINQSLQWDVLETEWEYDSAHVGNPIKRLPIGIYTYITWCNDSRSGGFSEGTFEVTTSGNQFKNDLFLIFALGGIILLALAYLIKNPMLGTISGMALMLSGVYTMIDGIYNLTSSYTQMIAVILIGVGAIITVAGIWSTIDEEDDS